MAQRGVVRALLALLILVATARCVFGQADGWRKIDFQTTQVTAPDVVVSPDGESLIFTMLGKLFRLPVSGGEAEQLTFGPHYDADPAISPDGKFVAFQSDRDGSDGNIFLLTLANKEIRQLTHESWAERPAWAPDGNSVVYLQLERKSWTPGYWTPRPPAAVRRVGLEGGEPETVRDAGPVWLVFYLPDGRVSWTLVERKATAEGALPERRSPPASYVTSERVRTRIEVRDSNGKVSMLQTLDGIADPVVPSPEGDGFYARSDARARTDVIFAPVANDSARRIFPVSGPRARFAVSADHKTVYIGNLGHLWRVSLPSGRREAVPFRANVTLSVREPTTPPAWKHAAPGATRPVRGIQQPRLSPDGSHIAFRALGRVWHQRLKNGEAEPLVETEGTQSDPAFSPDGRRLAFVRRARNQAEIQIVELQSRDTRTVAPLSECGYEQLTWSVHGELIAATSCDHDIIAIDPSDGAVRVLYPKASGWEPYPQLSADGQTLYFQAQLSGSDPAMYRLQMRPGANPERLFAASAGMDISIRRRWVAHPLLKRPAIRVAKFTRGRIEPTGAQVISEADGYEFSFTPDEAALLYISGNKLWRQPLDGGERQEIPIRLELRVPKPPTTLVRRVRMLDFSAGGFGAETSLLVEEGRIRWIGAEAARALPPDTVTVDAGGRFAIPGLFDMHGHGSGCGGPPHVGRGVLSVRNMGGAIEGQKAHAERSDFTGDPVPRCFYAGSTLEGAQGGKQTYGYVHAESDTDARAWVRKWKMQGASFIKIYNRLPWPLQRAAADEARRVGLPVVAHGLTLEQVVKGVILGYAGFTHWASGWPHWWSTTTVFYDDALQMFAASGTRWEPTLGIAVASGDEIAFRDDPDRFRRKEVGGVSLPDDVLRGMWAERLRTMRAAYRRGVTFLPGTDRDPEGLALHWELEFYAEAGIPPIDVLRFATQVSAETVGAQDHLGTLEPGKLADLVLLDANPLDDIRNTQTIWRVMKGGWMFDPKVWFSSRN